MVKKVMNVKKEVSMRDLKIVIVRTGLEYLLTLPPIKLKWAYDSAVAV